MTDVPTGRRVTADAARRGTPLSPGRAVPAPVVEARVAARLILEEARREATRLLGSLDADRERHFEEARAAAAREVSAKLGAAFAALADEVARWRAAREATLVEWVRAGVRAVLDNPSADEDARVAASVRALVAAGTSGLVTLRVHPDDAAAAAAEIARSGAPVTVLADASRPRGALRLEGAVGAVDVDREFRLDAFCEGLAEELSR